MKLSHVIAPALAALLATACAANSEQSATDRAAQAEVDRDRARDDARKAQMNAERARADAQDAARAQYEAESEGTLRGAGRGADRARRPGGAWARHRRAAAGWRACGGARLESGRRLRCEQRRPDRRRQGEADGDSRLAARAPVAEGHRRRLLRRRRRRRATLTSARGLRHALPGKEGRFQRSNHDEGGLAQRRTVRRRRRRTTTASIEASRSTSTETRRGPRRSPIIRDPRDMVRA